MFATDTVAIAIPLAKGVQASKWFANAARTQKVAKAVATKAREAEWVAGGLEAVIAGHQVAEDIQKNGKMTWQSSGELIGIMLNLGIIRLARKSPTGETIPPGTIHSGKDVLGQNSTISAANKQGPKLERVDLQQVRQEAERQRDDVQRAIDGTPNSPKSIVVPPDPNNPDNFRPVDDSGTPINSNETFDTHGEAKKAANLRIAQDALVILKNSCFVAGTPVLTPEGSKRIEQLKPGDLILSRLEDQPNAPTRPQVVEHVFELSAPILQARIGGRTIETTPEHPFYVAGRGWTRAENLLSGDLLVGIDDKLTLVESIVMTNRLETVYNVRVAEDHTYFVGDVDWGFSIWVHNAYSARQAADSTWEIVDAANKVIRQGIASEPVATRLAGLFNNMPDIRKVVIKKPHHSAEQAVERLGMDLLEAKIELRALSDDIAKNGIPPGTFPDPGKGVIRTDSILVPFRNGAAVYEIVPNGRAYLTTVLSPEQLQVALRKQGL